MTTDAEKLAAIRQEISHALTNGHHLSESCQGVDFQNLPPAVRIDYLQEILWAPDDDNARGGAIMSLEELEAVPVGGMIMQTGSDEPAFAIRRSDGLSGGQPTSVWHVTGDEQDWSSQDLLITWSNEWTRLGGQ